LLAKFTTDVKAMLSDEVGGAKFPANFVNRPAK